MYRVLIFLLSLLSLTLLALILSVTLWRDYERNGAVSLSRAFETALNGYSREPELAAKTGSELPALRQRLLYLINTERVRARVPPLTLGVNPAAQLHAENMLAHDYRSHWDINGLTPQMRYTLAGGAGRVLLNLAGPVAISASGDDGPEALRQAISGVHRSFMSQPEDAANLLDPWHQSVSLGVACNVSRCWVVQQFESSHVSFDELPAITGGDLSLAGQFAPGLELDSVAIWHHSYPRPLSLGQLDATYIYGYGQKPATFLRPPPPAGRYYPDALVSYEWENGIDPYTLEPSLSRSVAPHLPVELAQSAAVPWTTATQWEVAGPAFSIAADLSPVLEKFGPGVYTVQIWGKQDEERAPLTNYAIFVE